MRIPHMPLHGPSEPQDSALRSENTHDWMDRIRQPPDSSGGGGGGEASVRCKPCRHLRQGLAWPGPSPTPVRPSCCNHSRIVIQSPRHCHSPSWPLCAVPASGLSLPPFCTWCTSAPNRLQGLLLPAAFLTLPTPSTSSQHPASTVALCGRPVFTSLRGEVALGQ